MVVQLQKDVLPAVVPRRLPRSFTKERDWPSQGEWTYEDYERLPDDGRRYEIIFGGLYVTSVPGFDHQYAVMRLLVLLERFISEHQLGLVLAAPFEVRLPDIAAVVQPDLLFVASGREPSSGDQAFSGAPDLIVEVLSPSTTRTDRVVKFSAYERTGVREYWLVNPLARLVEVYALSEDDASEDDAPEDDASEDDASEDDASENDASEGDASEVYELHGEFISGSTVTSQVLPGLTFHVDDLFPSQC